MSISLSLIDASVCNVATKPLFSGVGEGVCDPDWNCDSLFSGVAAAAVSADFVSGVVGVLGGLVEP